MAPESLVDNIYTVQTDIWAFGVIIWEAMTFGQQPYPARNNMEVLQFVRGGGRLEKPPGCPDDIYALMRKCWHNTPSLRPSFSWAVQWLQDFLARYPSHEALEVGSNENNNNPSSYTQVHSSDEESVSALPLPRSEQRFTAAAFTNHVFHIDDIERPSIEGSTGTSGNGSNYFKVKGDEMWNSAAQTKTAAAKQQEINYSVLGFHQSRSANAKNTSLSSRHLRSKPLGAETLTRPHVDSKFSYRGFNSNHNEVDDFLAIAEEGSQSSLDIPVFPDYYQTTNKIFRLPGDELENSYAKFTNTMLRTNSQNSFDDLSSEEVSTVFDEPWEAVDQSPYMKYNSNNAESSISSFSDLTLTVGLNKGYAKVGCKRSETSNEVGNDSAYFKYDSDYADSFYSNRSGILPGSNATINEERQNHLSSEHRKRRRIKITGEKVAYV